MLNIQVIEVMNYHSFIESVGPTSLGPDSTGGGQPGFAVTGINATGTYVSPVAQVLKMRASICTSVHRIMGAMCMPCCRCCPCLQRH